MRVSYQLAGRLAAALFAAATLAACAGGPDADPRAGFSERNVGKTLITYAEGAGTRVIYLGPDRQLHIWSSASPDAQSGGWQYELLPTGGATTPQGAGAINQQIASPTTAWGICLDAPGTGQVPPPPTGGERNCMLLSDYEAQISERASDDIFNLRSGRVPAPMPPGRRLSATDLAALR